MNIVLIIIAVVVLLPLLKQSAAASSLVASTSAGTTGLLAAIAQMLGKGSSSGGGKSGGGAGAGAPNGSSSGSGQGNVGSSPDFFNYNDLTPAQQTQLANSWADLNPVTAPSIQSVDVGAWQPQFPTLQGQDYLAGITGPPDLSSQEPDLISQLDSFDYGSFDYSDWGASDWGDG